MRVFVLALLSAAACSSGGDLDCAFIASQNCWKSEVDQIETCAVPTTETGKLDAARTLCTFTDGHEVAFDEPLVLPISSSTTYRFTVRKGASTCVRFEGKPGGEISLTTARGTSGYRATSDGKLAVTCVDGSEHVASVSYQELVMCAGGIGGIPSIVTQGAGSSGGLDLVGGTKKQVRLFSCE
jgi:hypothetical protein